MKSNAVALLIEPCLEDFRVVPAGIVNDDNHEIAPASASQKVFEE